MIKHLAALDEHILLIVFFCDEVNSRFFFDFISFPLNHVATEKKNTSLKLVARRRIAIQ